MSISEPDIPISEFKGYEQIAEIVAGRSLRKFIHVDSFCYFRQEDILEIRTKVCIVLQ